MTSSKDHNAKGGRRVVISVDAMGGAGMATGTASSATSQIQGQGNMAASGFGGSDNLHADTNINV